MREFATHQTKQVLCPECGYGVDSATNAEDSTDAPRPGDFSICLYCGTILVFTEDLSLRKSAPEDYFDMPDDFRSALDRAQKIQKMIALIRPKTQESPQ